MAADDPVSGKRGLNAMGSVVGSAAVAWFRCSGGSGRWRVGKGQIWLASLQTVEN